MSGFVDSYRTFMETKSDPRTAEWFLMSSPGPLLTILATYLYFCISAGPRYMKDRKPYQLTNVIFFYNIVQIIFSVYIVHEGLVSGWATNYKFSCQPVDYSDDPMSLRMASAVWFYFICKLIELSDTVFFVLRKKYNQVSFLHLYHHFMMPICAWIGTKFLPGGHGTLLGLINSFIHIIMYTYYLLSSLGPQYQKYLWWKKYLTLMQMVQFIIIGYHNLQVLFRDCNFPKSLNALLGVEAILFLYMFGSFYYRTYISSKGRSIKAEAKNTSREHTNGELNSHNGVGNGFVHNIQNGNAYTEISKIHNGKVKEN